MQFQHIEDFQKSRAQKIGASEIAACIPHPERAGSVAGYGETALTIWEYKTGRRERPGAGFAADMGHALEPIILRKWITENRSPDEAAMFYRGYMLCELEKTRDGYPNATAYQTPPWYHHTRAENDYAIAHADAVNPGEKIIIEAKSAGSWAARRGDDIYSGYDADTPGHHGVPLRNYFQVQFQAAMFAEVYGVQIAELYVALLSDTSRYNQWQIAPDKRVQERLLEIASHMRQCIVNDTPPKTLAMNQADIKILYPKIEEDFRVVSGDELASALDMARQAGHAAKQVRAWTQKKQDAEDALSIILRDAKTVKGIIDGEIVDVATWQERAGAERIMALSEIRKSVQGEKIYSVLQENGLIIQGEPSKFVRVKYKARA